MALWPMLPAMAKETKADGVAVSWLTPAEAAKRLGFTTKTLARRSDDGTIRAHRVGDRGHRRYREQDIDALTGEGEQ